MADRYHYVPSIGLFVALVFGLSDLATAFRINRGAVGAITIAALSILTCLTTMQIDRWRDSATLLQYALSLTPDSRMLENNLGTVLGERGRYQEAETHFTKALQTKPDFMEAMSVSDADIRNQSRVAAGASGQTDGSNGTAK